MMQHINPRTVIGCQLVNLRANNTACTLCTAKLVVSAQTLTHATLQLTTPHPLQTATFDPHFYLRSDMSTEMNFNVWKAGNPPDNGGNTGEQNASATVLKVCRVLLLLI